MALFVRPDHEFGTDELVRASTLAGLPEHLRPSLPEMAEAATLGAANNGVLRPSYDKAIRTFASVRAHLAQQDPARLAELLAAHEGSGGTLDLELLATLAKRPGLLESVGIDSAAIHRQSISTLESVTGVRADDLASSLRLARNVIESQPAGDAAIAGLRTEALELADRNLARMAGERTDTYGRHPDYAEVGRFASIATLLHELRSAAEAAKPAAPVAETLAW
jgi:hypothetical protein